MKRDNYNYNDINNLKRVIIRKDDRIEIVWNIDI